MTRKRDRPSTLALTISTLALTISTLALTIFARAAFARIRVNDFAPGQNVLRDHDWCLR